MIKSSLKFITLIFASILFFSCDKRTCEEVICGINQNCSLGTCYCIDGYEGDNCQIQAYIKYIGNYYVQESCVPVTGNGSYNSYISWDGFQLNKLYISNFLNKGITAPAEIFTNEQNKGNIIEIQYSQGLLQNVFGTGNYREYFTPPKIEIEMEFNQAGQFHQCLVTYYKQ